MAGDLPLEGAPIRACHSTSGSVHPGATCIRTPAPQSPPVPAISESAT